MKSLLSKSIPIFLVLALLIGIERLSHSITDGFSYSNITSSLPHNPEWEITFAKEDLKELEVALQEPFHYLGSGSQSYVFASQNDKYVLKFFKHKRWRLSPLLELLPLPQALHNKRILWKERKKRTINRTLQSSKIAYEQFKAETGVIFVHLNKSLPFDCAVSLKDRLGIKHTIPLKNVEFVLQKKAIPTDEYLLSLKKEGKIKEAKKAISDLIDFTLLRAQMGYSDKDPHLIRNFGFLDGKIVQIDIGGFFQDPKKDLTYYKTHEIKRIHDKLLPWLEENYEELKTSYFIE